MKKCFLFGLLALALATMPFAGGCGTSGKTASTGKTAGSPAKTLTVGFVGYYGQLGYSDSRCIQAMAAIDNAKGGIDIGGVKYKVNVICYDNNNVQATEVAAVNRLIFQDHAQVILTDSPYMGAWLATAEAHKVLTFGPQGSEVNLAPKWHYSFNPSGANTGFPLSMAWYVKEHPKLAGCFALALPDSSAGHFFQQLLGTPAEAMGAKMHYLYYPPSQTDLSALGTKMEFLHPTAVSAVGSGDAKDSLAMASAWNAGYRGPFFDASTVSYGTLAKEMPAKALEGMLAGAWPTEFDPPLTPEAKAFKDAYVAKFGKWDNPNIYATAFYACMKAGMQAAGTTDPDKVAAVIAGGLKFSGPGGDYQMIARPDLGNTRTVDSVGAKYFKSIKDGKPVLVATMTVPEGISLWNQLLKAEAKMKH